MSPLTPAEITARLVRTAEELVRIAADALVLVQSEPVAPVVVQAAPGGEGRISWTVAQFAKAMGLDRNTVYALIKRGEIRAGKVNQSLRISEVERVRWWAEREQQYAAELGASAGR